MYVLVALFLISLDQIASLIARNHGVLVSGRWFEAAALPSFLIAIAGALLIGWVRKQWLGPVLVSSGAISNLITYILLGGAVDYIPLMNYRLDVADIWITAGCILIAVTELKKDLS